MDRRDFIALSTAPLASQMLDRASKLEIDLDRDGRGAFKIRRDSGILEENDYAAPDGFQWEQKELLQWVRELLAEFERRPRVNRPLDQDAPPRADEIIDRATHLNITVYRGEKAATKCGLEVLTEIGGEVVLDDYGDVRFLRELLAAFDRKPDIYEADSANKVFPI